MSKKDTIEVITENSLHWYPSKKKKGVYWPSITSILSIYPKGIGFNRYLTEQSSWQSAQEQLEEAGARGTAVHRATEMLEQGLTLKQESYPVDQWQMLMGFVNWYNEYSPKIIASELKLVSDKLKTGGTIDRIYEIGGKNILLDIKTSKKIYNNYWVQVAAYEKLLLENKSFPKIDGLSILRLTPLRKCCYEYIVIESWKELWELFQSCQRIWQYENGKDSGPKIISLPKELKLTLAR